MVCKLSLSNVHFQDTISDLLQLTGLTAVLGSIIGFYAMAIDVFEDKTVDQIKVNFLSPADDLQRCPPIF